MVQQAPTHTGDDRSSALRSAIRRAIAEAGGALPFDRFMAMALYEPELGYYTRDDRKRVGAAGDFITSVSVGRCFGMLLARHLAPKLAAMAQSAAGELIVAEPGAEGGQLAADVMAELGEVLPPEVFGRVRYVTVEPFGSKRALLGEALAERGVGEFEVVSGWDAIRGARGVVVANEVLDAMPVKRFRRRDGAWWEIAVASDGDAFTERLVDSAQAFGELAEDFTVERNPALGEWFGELSASFDELHACIVDYGLERTEDFFDPGRCGGTLRAYQNHQLSTDPLVAPGEIDLTAHVDFEAASNSARAAGLQIVGLTDQHHFLVNAARGWLLEIEARGAAPDAETAKVLRQFQSLSHPSAMGMAFKVLEVAKS